MDDNKSKSLADARVINRTLTKKECHWLKESIEQGKFVYIYHGHTYGCISPSGIAVSRHHGETPFFEVPKDALSIP